MSSRATVAVLSDTHGLLRDEVVSQIRGVDHIVHAGDVGDPQILIALREIAPVTAVRGNVDHGAWASELPLTETIEIGRHVFYVIHILDDLDVDLRAGGFRGVIFGHTHQPLNEDRDGVLYLNPGSIGPRRFQLPISFATLEVDGDLVTARLTPLA